MRGTRELGVGGGAVGGRVPQWGQQETRELIAIRGEMEKGRSSGGAAASNNKTLWEEVAARMSQQGYSRTPDQCKCKWKNLVNRYKGKETSDPENGRHCPFFDELHEVFNERARSMQRQLLESETGGGPSTRKKPKRSAGDLSSYELSGDDDNDDDVSDDETKPAQARDDETKLTHGRRQKQRTSASASTSGRLSSGNSIQELLQGFLQQQQVIEVQWRDAMERRARDRMLFEQGWRESMERLERERLMLEQSWMEREEQRRIREEARAEKRDHLLTALLSMLQNDL